MGNVLARETIDLSPLTSDPQFYLHQPPLAMTLLTPGLTEEECRRYQELLEVKGQYEKGNQAPLTDGVETEGQGAELQEEARAPPLLSEHEVALIEEELRHLEFKCRNILRAQKMQQLRERCLKAWMMEEETAAAAAAAGSGTNFQHAMYSILTRCDCNVNE